MSRVDHDGWFDLTPEERRLEYARRKNKLEKILVDVRMHRLEECAGAPLCPGADAADKLAEISPLHLSDFLATCLAVLADDREDIENLRASRKLMERRRDEAVGEIERLETELAATRREADAGWEAYRLEVAKRQESRPASGEFL